MNTPLAYLTKNYASDLKGKHILLAEDEPINLKLATKMLQAFQATISVAETGAQVLDILNKGVQPDLILMDLWMPEMDGYEAISKISQQFPKMTVLAFTAAILDDETETDLKKRGFSGCIPKNFKPDIFFNSIFNALHMHAA